MTSTSSRSYKFKRIALRAFLGIALLGAITLLSGVVFLDSVAQTLLSPNLSNVGVHLERLRGLRLRPQYIELDRLEFRVNDSTESSHIQNLTVHFNWKELLNGRVMDVHVKNVTLALVSASTQRDPDPAASSIKFPTMSDIKQQLESAPLDSLIIDSLTVSPFLESSKVTLNYQVDSLEFDLSTPTHQLDLTLDWQSELPLESPSRVSGRLTLADVQHPALNIEFSLTEPDSRLSLESTVRLQAERIQTLLATHELYAYDSATLSGDFHFDLLVTPSTIPDQGFDFDLKVPTSQSLSIQLDDNAPMAMRNVEWQNNSDLTLSGSVGWTGPSVAVNANSSDGVLVLTSPQSATSRIAFGFTPLTLRCNNPSQCSGSLISNVHLDTFTADQTSANDLVAISDISFSIEPELTQLSFAQGSRIELGSAQVNDIAVLNANVLAQESLELALHDDGTWQFSTKVIDLFVPELVSADKGSHFAVSFQGLQGEIGTTGGTSVQLESDLQFRNLGSDWAPVSLRAPEVDMSIRINDENLALQGNVSLANRKLLQLDVQWALLANSGSVQASIPTLQFSQGRESLSQLFYRAPFNADLFAGTVQGSATLQVQQDDELNWFANGPITLSASSLSGFYEDIGVINLSTAIQGELIANADFKTDQNQELRIERIDVGVPVENIMINYAIDTQNTLVTIDALEATLFGGKVRSNPVQYDWSAPRNEAEISIERVDLSRMLDIAAYDAVQATGFISGTLPVSLSDYNPAIGQGELYVEAPGGIIRYSSIGGGGGSNAALDFVNQALSNYQYDLMETTVEYKPSGELDLGVRLQGLNPDMNNGQRINLNLNISDNIPALLQSLQSGRSIADAVERALQ